MPGTLQAPDPTWAACLCEQNQSVRIGHIFLWVEGVSRGGCQGIFWLGHCMEIAWQQIQDATYRWEVISGLMQDYAAAILQYCTTRLGEGMGEEVTQEVFVAAWQQLPTYRPKAPLQMWLFAIARRKCQQAYRNRARRQAIARLCVEEIRARTHSEGPPSPEGMVTQASQAARLAACLTQLRETDRILLTMWYWKELPISDIADILGKSVAAIRKQLLRAQQRLKEFIDAPS